MYRVKIKIHPGNAIYKVLRALCWPASPVLLPQMICVLSTPVSILCFVLATVPSCSKIGTHTTANTN